MAEILGAVASGMTIAGLIKLSLEAFEIIQVARKQGIDYQKLALRLSIERARLYTWGQAMGFGNQNGAEAKNLLRDSPFEPLVRQTLELIIQLFQDGEKLRGKYGCVVDKDEQGGKQVTTLSPSSTALDHLAASFARFRIQDSKSKGSSNIRCKTKWVVYDRQKFGDLIQEIRIFIDGLQDITKSLSTIGRQESMMRYSIQQITDPDTLSLVSEICQNDYPDVTDAASVKLDVVSLATDRRCAIESWAVAADNASDLDSDDYLEQLTITELKELLRRKRLKDNQAFGTLVDYDADLEPNAAPTKHIESSRNGKMQDHHVSNGAREQLGNSTHAESFDWGPIDWTGQGGMIIWPRSPVSSPLLRGKASDDDDIGTGVNLNFYASSQAFEEAQAPSTGVPPPRQPKIGDTAESRTPVPVLPRRDTDLDSYTCACHGWYFWSNTQLNQHVAMHVREFECEIPDCPMTEFDLLPPSFDSFASRRRHYESFHHIRPWS